MADEKISDLTDGSPLQDTDEFVVARAGSNVKIPGSAMGGGGAQLLDLGVVTAISLLAGPKTLYTPTAGEFVQVFIEGAGFVATDTNAATPKAQIGPFLVVPPETNLCQYGTTINNSAFQGLPLQSAVSDGSAIIAGLDTNETPYNIIQTAPAWQALHSYVGPFVINGGDGHYWSTPTDGVSGAIAPDFAGNEGGTVVDGTITWTDEGVIPTMGSGHFYALVAPAG